MFPRHIHELLLKRYETARSLYIFGPRQSGKTTIAKATFPFIPYFNLEKPNILDQVKSDPLSFLKVVEMVV